MEPWQQAPPHSSPPSKFSEGQNLRPPTLAAIAQGTDNEHKSVIQLVRAYLDDIQEFGEVTFEMRLNPQGSPTEFALLRFEIQENPKRREVWKGRI